MKLDKLVKRVVDNYRESNFDPNGSYTGIDTQNPMDLPTQDADDL